MADFHALGGVSATLKTLLLDRMEIPDGVTALSVTIGPPAFSSKDTDPRLEDPRVNLFLYRVTENGYLQNQEIPGRGSSGGYGHPPLSLNLHYLVTAYGNTEVSGSSPVLYDDRNAHFLLGSAMRALHDSPIITPSLKTARAPAGTTILDDSLRNEYEQVKLALEPLTLEDVTKVWTALALRYRLSAGYVVNVVQIESRRPKRFPKPVGQPISATVPPLPSDPPSPGPMVYVFPTQVPSITGVTVLRPGDPAEQTYPYARIGDTLVIRGSSLNGTVTELVFGDLRVPATSVTGELVEAVIPDTTVAGRPIPVALQLQPGIRTVQVADSDPVVPQRVTTSNAAAFMLVPSIDPATITYSAAPTRRVTLNGTRLVSPAPGGAAMIGRAAVERTAYLAATPTQLVVPIPDTLPTFGVQTIVSAPLSDPIVLPAVPALSITINGVARNLSPTLGTQLSLAAAADVLAGIIHNAKLDDPNFTGTRVDLYGNRLVVVPGGLTNTIVVGAWNLATALGLSAPQPAGGNSAYVSGALGSPPPLTSSNPRLKLKIGGASEVVLTLPRALSLADLAAVLQAAIQGASAAPEYTGAQVMVSGTQLLIVPGVAGAIVFSAAPGDDTTVAELQLHAKFAVRVRVNDAESIDNAVLELPQ